MESKAVQLGLVGLILLTGASCSSTSQSVFPERVFSAPWSMDAVALESLKTKVNALKVGDKVDHVLETVGIPDSDQSYNKNGRNRIFTYYVTRSRVDSPNESDRVVKIALDQQNKVKAIYSNVEDIRSRNWP